MTSPVRWPGRVRQYDRALAAIASLVERLQHEADGRGDTVVAVGVAAAAFLEADREHVRDATNLIDWRGRPFRADLSARLGLPVVVENDGNAAVWGEYVHGVATGEPCVVMATVGTGIGGGIVLDGRLVVGASGLAAELGHVQVVPEGRPCGCGAAGCLEEYASGTALTRSVRAAARADAVSSARATSATAPDPAGAPGVPAADAVSAARVTSATAPDPAGAPGVAAADAVSIGRLLSAAGGDPESIDGPLITALALDGDPMARQAFAELGTWLGVGLAQVATILNPSIVIVGGGLAGAAGDLILDPARAAFAASSRLRGTRPPAPIHAAALGNTAGLVGAAALARTVAAPPEPTGFAHAVLPR